MKSFFKNILFIFVLLTSIKPYAQHHSHIDVEVNMEKKTLTVQQQIEYFNQTEDTLMSIVLNDWNNAYSSKTTPLAKRFSDEFYRGFHLASEKERGSTNIINISSTDRAKLSWERTEKNPDFIIIKLENKRSAYIGHPAYSLFQQN